MTRARVCIFHNAVAPYRLALFDRLARDADVTVLFGLERPADRRWSASLDGAMFSSRVLPALAVGPLVVNPTLPRELLALRPEVVIHADSDENLTSLLVAFALRRLLGYDLLLWVEHVPRTPAALRTTLRARRPHRRWVTSLALRTITALRRWAYRRADGLLSMSGPASDRFIADIGGHGPVFTGTQVLPRRDLLAPDRDRRRPDRRRILYLGYLRANKNVAALVTAFCGVAGADAELVIAGDGPELDELRRLAGGRSDIHFAGHVDGHEKVALLTGADLLVLPSFVEPWGLVVNEALYYGVPVLVGRSVASSILVEDGRSGLLFDPDSTDELAVKLRAYLGDPALRQALRDGVGQLDLDRVVGVEHGVEHFERALLAMADRRRT